MEMSIKSTQDITRQNAINRIIEISLLVKDRNFYELEKITNESGDTSFSNFIQEHNWYNSFYDYSDMNTLNKFTNATLEDIMDSPFYRFSIFENYIILKE
jgi:hypothetical protein